MIQKQKESKQTNRKDLQNNQSQGSANRTVLKAEVATLSKHRGGEHASVETANFISAALNELRANKLTRVLIKS